MLNWWYLHELDDSYVLYETQWKSLEPNGGIWINGAPASSENMLRLVSNLEVIDGEAGENVDTGRVGAIEFLAIMGDKDSVVKRWKSSKFQDGEDDVTVYYPVFTTGDRIMRPG